MSREEKEVAGAEKPVSSAFYKRFPKFKYEPKETETTDEKLSGKAVYQKGSTSNKSVGKGRVSPSQDD